MLFRELGDRLADVAVVVHDLLDAEPELQQVPAMRGGALADGGLRVVTRPGGAIRSVRTLRLERGRKLRQEVRHPVLQLGRIDGRRRSAGDLGARARDELCSVVPEKLIECHTGPLTGSA